MKFPLEYQCPYCNNWIPNLIEIFYCPVCDRELASDEIKDFA